MWSVVNIKLVIQGPVMSVSLLLSPLSGALGATVPAD